MTKLKNSNCDQTQKLKLCQNLKKNDNSKTKIVTKLKFWQNSQIEVVTVVIATVALVTVVIVTSFSKNNLTPQQPMRFLVQLFAILAMFSKVLLYIMFFFFSQSMFLFSFVTIPFAFFRVFKLCHTTAAAGYSNTQPFYFPPH